MKSAITVSLVPEARGGPFVLWDDLPAACLAASQLGFDAIEVFAAGPTEIRAPELAGWLGDHGLKLAALGTGAGWLKHRLHFALPDAAKRRQAVDFARSIIDVGATFAAPAIIGSMQGRSGEGVSRELARGYLAEALQALGEHAAARGTFLLYEPLNRYETDQINTVADGVEMLRGLPANQVRLLCDLFHMNIEEVDVASALRQAGPRLGHVHFVDSNRRPVGRGHLDLRPIIAALREANYQGYLSAEALPDPDSQSAAEQTMKAFRYYTS